MSNWNRAQLSDKQIEYAAFDAIASIQIYHELERAGLFSESSLLSWLKQTLDFKTELSLFQSNKKALSAAYFTTLIENDRLLELAGKFLKDANLEDFLNEVSEAIPQSAKSFEAAINEVLIPCLTQQCSLKDSIAYNVFMPFCSESL